MDATDTMGEVDTANGVDTIGKADTVDATYTANRVNMVNMEDTENTVDTPRRMDTAYVMHTPDRLNMIGATGKHDKLGASWPRHAARTARGQAPCIIRRNTPVRRKRHTPAAATIALVQQPGEMRCEVYLHSTGSFTHVVRVNPLITQHMMMLHKTITLASGLCD